MNHSHHIFGLTGCHVMRGDGKDTAESAETTDQNQVGVQAGGTGSVTNVAGQGAETANSDSLILKGGSSALNGNKGVIDITSSDPEVATTALNDYASTAQAALDTAQNVSLGGEEESETLGSESLSVANNAITSVQQSANSALNTVGQNSTDLEDIASQYEQGLLDSETQLATVANNATTGSNQPVGSYEIQQPTLANQGGGSTSLANIGWIVTIAAGIFAVYYYLKGKKG